MKLTKEYSSRYLSEEREDYIPKEGELFTNEIHSATATVKPPSTNLNDLFISVKTTKHYHKRRLLFILKTWFQLAKAQVKIFKTSLMLALIN